MPRFHVHRSIMINATPEVVFGAISDFSTWTTWSPWLCADPDAKVTFSKNPNSVGSRYTWDGDVVGSGELEHAELDAPRFIQCDLRFLKPWKSNSKTTFEIEAVGNTARVTWHMYGSMPWFMFWMVPMMESYIGNDYERGLKMLKEWLETGRIFSRSEIAGLTSLGPIKVLGVRKNCTYSDIGASMETAFKEVAKAFEDKSLPTGGEAVTVYHKADINTGAFEYTAGISVPEQTQTIGTGLTSWTLPKMNAFHVRHIGSYEHLGNAWSAVYQNVTSRKLKKAKIAGFEIYRNDPAHTLPADLITDIYLPLKS